MKISKPASRIFALLLAVFMVFGMLPVSAFAVEENTVTYSRVTDEEIQLISGNKYVIVDYVAGYAMSADDDTIGAVSVTFTDDDKSQVVINKTDVDKVSFVISDAEPFTYKGDPNHTSGEYDVKHGNYYLDRNSQDVYLHTKENLKAFKSSTGNSYHQWDYKNAVATGDKPLPAGDNFTNLGGEPGQGDGIEYFSLNYNSSSRKWQASKDANHGRIYLYAVEENTTPPTPEDPTYTAPEAATGLTYNGEAQALVTGGTVTEGGTMLYKLGNGEYSATVPSATDAGTYTVSWMVDGEEGYNDFFAEQPITVTIAAKTVTPAVTVDPASVAYDGTAKQPTTVTVKDGETVIPASEYTVASTNNTNAGTATVTVTDKANGNYAFTTATGSFTITAKTVTPTVTLSQESYTYDGTAKQPTVTVKDGETVIPVAEYTVTYADNTNAGTAKVTVTDNANGNYTFDSVEKSFTISAHTHNWTYTASGATITATCSGAGTCVNAEKTQTITVVEPTDLVYSGTAKVATITGAIDGVTTPAIVYSAAECKNVGEYTASITLGEGTAAATATVSFTIAAKTVTPTVTVAPTSVAYDGTAKQPTTVTVKDGETVIPASEYTVASTNNINAGTATVTVTDKTGGNYAFTTATGSFTITAKTVTPTVTVDPTSFTYDGTAKQPTTVTVKDGETVIPADEYTVATTNNTNAGTATVTVTDKANGNYAFTTATGSFTITAKTVTPTVTLSQESYTYDGTAKQPTVTVKDGETVIPADEYTVTYADNTNAGTAKVTVTDNANGNYSFTAVTKNFTITAPAVESTVTYTKIDAEDIKATDKIIIVGNTGSKTVALSKNGQEVNVTVSGETVTVSNASDVANILWTVGASNTQQANGQSKSFTFNIGGGYLARESGSGYVNNIEILTTGLDVKYVGHYEDDGTFGNDSGSVEPPFYGLAYTSDGFKYVNSNDSTYETVVGYMSYYKEVTVADDDEDDTVAVTGVTLNKTSTALTVGATETLTATVAPEGATNKNVSWTSSDATIASVSNAGVVTAVKAGAATITVTTADGSFTASCTVTVSAASVAVTGVSLNKNSTTLTVGASETLTATVTPSNATNATVTWTSNNTAVATVDNTGKVTAVARGAASITATAGGMNATCTVTVTTASTPDEDEEPTYTKINASDIKAGDKIVIVGVSGNSYYALTNGSTQTTAVTVSNNELTITGSPNALVWTVGEATGNQVDTANAKFTISNDGDYLARVSGSGYTNDITFKASDLNTKYVGHAVLNGTIGNNSGSVEPPFYGLAYTNDGFKYVNENETGYVSNSTTPNVLFFRAYNVADGEGGGNQGGNEGGNEGGSATNPTGTTFLAFSSDAHTKTKNVNEGSPARLNNWLNNVSSKISGTFDIMALCGDFTYDGGSGITGTDYWDHAAAVMSVVENSAKVDGHVYINGNHEWQHGSYDSYKSSHDAAKKITGIGQKITGDDYIIYTFGAASSSQAYNTSDITALGNWLKTAPTDKPIFIISHYPIHSISGRSTTNADTLLTTLNEYADDHDIYFVWGHNHTKADIGENHYDKIYTGTLDNQTIKFTYMAAGCMSDSENNTGSAAVKGKGLVAKIVDGKVETLTYYGESGNVVGTPYEVPDDSADPDQPGTEDPEDPIVPDEPGKVTTLEDGYYIIVSNNNTKALTNVVNSGYTNTNSYTYSGFNGADVTISSDKITAGATEAMVFEIKAVSGGYTIRNVEKDQYLTATYTQNTSGSGYTGKLFLSDTAETWELDSNFRLKSTNASATGRDGLGLYLTFDDKTDSISSGAANFFGIRSEGDNHDFANVDKIDFYKVEIKEEPEPEQPEQPEHKHTWGEATYTFAADGKSCTATRACTEDVAHTESATATITSAEKTAATCETMGTTTYTATFTEEWAETQTKDVQDIPVIAHVFENGECTNCGTEDPAEADLFELYAASMNLGNSLAMNFFIEIEDLEFGEDYYAVITKDYADGREDLKITVQDEDWQEYNSELLRITINKIAAKEMSDCVTVVIFNDEGEQVSKTWVDSVRDYTMRGVHKEMAKADPNEELMAVYVELLNYGAAAQEVFDYNVDDLANNELTEAHQAYGLNNVQMEDFRVSEGAFAGTSLSLESNILMNFYFNIDPADYEGLKAVATYTDHYGHDHEVTFDGDDFSKYNSTIWGVSLETLVVADCREFVTVKVYEADGDLLASVTDSMEGYAARRGANDTMSISIMTFAVAAYNYFH